MAEITIEVSDGTTMRATTARPDGARNAPGLLLFPEAFGLNHHIRDVVGRFAALGYVVISPEIFHRTADPGWEADYTDMDSVRPHLSALTVDGIVADARATYEAITRDPGVDPERIATIGYCVGGRCAFIANTALPVKAGVSYYGGGIDKAVLARASLLNAPHLFFWGGKDNHLSPAYRDAITSALDEAKKPYVNVVISDAEHGFNCNERKAYKPEAAADALALTAEFLASRTQR